MFAITATDLPVVNVYTRATFSGTLITLLLLVAFMVGEVWALNLFPTVHPYWIHAAAIALFLFTLRSVFHRR